MNATCLFDTLVGYLKCGSWQNRLHPGSDLYNCLGQWVIQLINILTQFQSCYSSRLEIHVIYYDVFYDLCITVHVVKGARWGQVPVLVLLL